MAAGWQQADQELDRLHAQGETGQMQTPVVERFAGAWGERVIAVFDRGWAGGPWLQVLAETPVRFIERWPKHYLLWDPAKGQERKAWEIVRGKRSWETRLVWDAHLHLHRSMGVVAVPVGHSDYAAPLWLVVARSGGGREPWYVLTKEVIGPPRMRGEWCLPLPDAGTSRCVPALAKAS